MAISDHFVKYRKHHGKTANYKVKLPSYASGEVIALPFYTKYKTLCHCYQCI